MKERLKTFGWFMLFVGLVSMGIAFQVYRWIVFQDATDSDVSFWKWLFLIDASR